MKRSFLSVAVLFFFYPSLVLADPTTELTVGYDTDNFDESTCQLRLKVMAHFDYDTLNFCGIGNACDAAFGEITVSGPGSPYTLLSDERESTYMTCNGNPGPAAESTYTQIYLVSPSVSVNVLARIRKICNGVTSYYAEQTTNFTTKSLDEDSDGYSICGSMDCNDQDPAINSNRVEICDGYDNNCDGQVDNVVDQNGNIIDQDNDGSNICFDCDDHNDSKIPGQDLDGDNVDSCTDCDDGNPLAQTLGAAISGGIVVTGVEVCNQEDDNCSGTKDENVGSSKCEFCNLKGYDDPVNFMSGAATTLPQRDFVLKGINGLDLDFYRTYSNQVRNDLVQAMKVMVQGTVDDVDIQTVQVNGIPTPVVNGRWQQEVTLAPGSNTITATATLDGVPLQDTANVTAVPTSLFALGPGWTHSFNIYLVSQADGAVIIQNPNGGNENFYPDGQGGYISLDGSRSSLVPDVGGFRWIEGDGKTYTFDANGFLTGISDRFSNTITLSYQSNRLTTITDTVGRQITFTYNTNGNLEYITGPSGQLAAYTYNAFGNLATATNSAGETTTYIYQDLNDSHNLTSIHNNSGQTILNVQYDSLDRTVYIEGGNGANGLTISYDASGQTTVTNSEGGVTIYNYSYDPVNGSGNIQTNGVGCSTCGGGNVTNEVFGSNYTLLSSTDRNGNTTTYTYDSRGNVLTKTEAYGTPRQQTTTYTHHPEFNFVLTEMVQSVLDSQQIRRITYDYDTDGNGTSNENPGLSIRRQIVDGWTKNGSGGLVSFQQITYFTYDGLGRLTQTDGPRTDVTDTTVMTYYPVIPGDPKSGMPANVSQATGTGLLTTTSNSYDARGNATHITDPNGHATTYAYDPLNRLITITQQGDTTTYAYDANGNIDLVTLPSGNTIDYTYDTANHLTEITDALGNKIRYDYDTQGNRIREERKDPSGAIKTFLDMQYDLLNRLQKVTNPDSTFTEYGYDLNGNRTSLQGPNQNVTSYAYDELNRLTQTTQPGSITTILTYDTQDHLVSVTDGNSNTTTYEYDDGGRAVTLISPDTGTTRYTYDNSGNLITKLDAKGILVTYTYDALNRITQIAFPDSSQNITYTYDGVTANGLGRLTGMTDPSGITTYSYTSKGQLYQEVKIFTGLIGSFTTTYSYDGNGNLTGITYPSGRQVTYAVDSADRVTEVSGTINSVTTPYATFGNYLPYGPYRTITLNNGLTTTIAYDNQYRFDGQTIASSQTIFQNDYTHDANGNITAITDLLNSTKNKTYGYDALDRLTSATGPWPSSGSLSYTYDPVGNRLTEGGSLGSSTYSYIDNLLTGVTGSKTLSFSYDASGNTVVENNKTYIYNQNNRLIQVTENGNTLGTYVYDGQGRRVKKVANSQMTYFMYDLQSRLIAEVDGSGDVTTEYIYLLDRPLVKIGINGSTEEAYYYHTDHLGTPLSMSNDTGQIVWSGELLPFGEGYAINEDVDGNQVNVVNNLRFPGQYYDSETGLHYNMARDYESQVGRYIESDPLGLEAGMNTFVYGENNTLIFMDPWGLDALVYDLQEGKLYWMNDSNEKIGTWEAISGPFGKGPLPSGSYILNQPPSLVPPAHPKQHSFCDSSGNCWWQPINPVIKNSRDRLGIHPDGGRSGTEGCVGVKNDTSSLYFMLNNYLKAYDSLPMRVQ